MAINQILVSSDHHANWDALEKLFQVAQNNKIPFVINGDVIGDYHFETLANDLELKFPHETNSEETVSNHRIQLRALYKIIVKFHARDLAELIDKYNVETYFLNGNHEPVYFPSLVKDYLKNKNLFKNLGEEKGILNVNGLRICGISNVCSLMPFLEDLYSESELDKDFSHQRGNKRPLLYRNVNRDYLESSSEHLKDFDWVRIMKDDKKEFDVFFTHGQIGVGAWRDDKNANEMMTLHVAAMLSLLSKLTVDGHLHSTHQMKNSLGCDTVRAVGNSAFLLTKENEEIKKELIKVDAEYDNRGKYDFNHHDLNNLISSEIIEKIDFEKLLL